MFLALSRSASFDRYLQDVFKEMAGPRILRTPSEFRRVLKPGPGILILHATSCSKLLPALLAELDKRPELAIGIAADAPDLSEMLGFCEHGIRAYFNSYMADTHYKQMLRLLAAGQTWFTPQLLAQALKIAQRTMTVSPVDEMLGQLTPREREVSWAVAEGLSNKEVANAFGITERTVKAHLTHVFEKLKIRDRVTLAITLSQQPGGLKQQA